MDAYLKYFPGSVEYYLNKLNLRADKVNKVAFISLYQPGLNSFFGGLNHIRELRLILNPNPVVLLSFYPKSFLSKYPEYNVVNLPGIYLAELPSLKQDLLDIIYSAVPISVEKLNYSLKYFSSDAGKAALFLKTIRSEDVEKINNMNKFLQCTYGFTVPDDKCNNIADLKSLLFELLPKYEIKKQLTLFSHGKDYDLINNSFGPLLALYKSYYQGRVKEDLCSKIVIEFLSNDDTIILKDKLNKLVNDINYLFSIEEFELNHQFTENSILIKSAFPNIDNLNFSAHYHSLNTLLDFIKKLQTYSESAKPPNYE